MPMFMDRHDVPGATAKDVAEAHVADLEAAGKYDVQFLSYWFDAETGGVFCFAKAPSKDALAEVHSKSHGLIPNEIIDVAEDEVFKFLGSVQDPKDASEVSSPLRTILFTDIVSSTEILDAVGEAAFMEVLKTHDGIVRAALYRHRGREVKHTGDGILASFDSATDAVEGAIWIAKGFDTLLGDDGSPIRVRVGMAAGRPVDRNDDIYGEAVVLASRLCGIAEAQQILAAASVREHTDEVDVFIGPSLRTLKGFAEPVSVFEIRAGSQGVPEPMPEVPQKPSWFRRMFRSS